MELNQENLAKLMRFKPSLADTANIFNVSEDTISRRINEWEKITFKEFRNKHSFSIRQRLIDQALQMAITSPAMMIFCLKNYCGWQSNPEGEIEESGFTPIIMKIREPCYIEVDSEDVLNL